MKGLIALGLIALFFAAGVLLVLASGSAREHRRILKQLRGESHERR